MDEPARRELGATAVEYAIVVGLIAVVILGAVSTLGSSIWGEDVEVLGRVLQRDADGEPDDPVPVDTLQPLDAPRVGGPDCDALKEHAAEPNPNCD